MYRGSSFLLQKNYKIHTAPVELIGSKKDAIKDAIKDKTGQCLADFLLGTKSTPVGLWNELSNNYNVKKGKSSSNGSQNDEEPTKMTDTLFTKILLGVYGCIPAFDRFYKAGVHACGGTSKFGKNAIKEIYEYWNRAYKGNQSNCDYIKHNLGCNDKNSLYNGYTDMKLMDMCFFTIGNRES